MPEFDYRNMLAKRLEKEELGSNNGLRNALDLLFLSEIKIQAGQYTLKEHAPAYNRRPPVILVEFSEMFLHYEANIADFAAFSKASDTLKLYTERYRDLFYLGYIVPPETPTAYPCSGCGAILRFSVDRRDVE